MINKKNNRPYITNTAAYKPCSCILGSKDSCEVPGLFGWGWENPICVLEDHSAIGDFVEYPRARNPVCSAEKRELYNSEASSHSGEPD